MLTQNQEAYLGRLRAAVSEARLGPYLKAAKGDVLRTLARYFWNAELCKTFLPVLQALEVSLRNRLDSTLAPYFPVHRYDHVNSWLDRQPRVVHHKNAENDLWKAKYHLFPHDGAGGIRPSARPILHGDLVAALDFGFWTALLHLDYEKSSGKSVYFWPDHFAAVFPAAPAERTVPGIRTHLNEIRHLRNRVVHHEPIWKKRETDPEPKDRYDGVVDALKWVSPEHAKATVRMHLDRDVFKEAEYLSMLEERLLAALPG